MLTVVLYFLYILEFDDYAEIVDDDPDYAHPMAGKFMISMVENFADGRLCYSFSDIGMFKKGNPSAPIRSLT